MKNKVFLKLNKIPSLNNGCRAEIFDQNSHASNEIYEHIFSFVQFLRLLSIVSLNNFS